jgi:hypothetical protein
MTSKISWAVFVGVVLMAGIRGVEAAQAQDTPASSLGDQLKTQYKLAKMGSDSNGWSVVETGTVLVIQKGGILGVPPGNAVMAPATYKDGDLHGPNGFGVAFLGQNTRQLTVGEKVYVTKIDVHAKNDKITLTIVECDSCNGVQQPSSYKSAVVFQFPKDYLSKADPSQINDVISRVLAPDASGEQQQAQTQQEQTPDQSAPAPQAMQLGQTIDNGPSRAQQQGQEQDTQGQPPATVQLGQTPDQVVAILGQPIRMSGAGRVKIYSYKDIVIGFTDDKVTRTFALRQPLQAQRPAEQTAPRPTAPQTVAPAPADLGWTLVSASDWRTRAPALVGNRVEMSGNLSTLLMVNPSSSFSNIGWMRDAGNKELATVLFDQIGDAELAWMRKNRCSETCAGVFVRGVVVSGRGRRAQMLRMIDVSFESRAGAAPASMVQLDSGHGDTPAVEKQLLPPGGVPTSLGPAAVTQMPAATPESTADKNISERMQDHSLKMRQRDLNWEKGMIPGSERPANFETYYRSIRDTRLSRVFVNYPWNTGHNTWPRVALVVEEEPIGGTGALGYMQGGDKIKDRCWRLRARLWTGPAASSDIAPFNWCLSEMRFNVSYSAVALWGMTPATSMAEHNTGPERTLGPNPPYLAAPRFHYADGSHSDTIMLGNILLDMSFGLGVPDGRVWIVDGTKGSFPGVATGLASDTTTRAAIDSNTKGHRSICSTSLLETRRPLWFLTSESAHWDSSSILNLAQFADYHFALGEVTSSPIWNYEVTP